VAPLEPQNQRGSNGGRFKHRTSISSPIRSVKEAKRHTHINLAVPPAALAQQLLLLVKMDGDRHVVNVRPRNVLDQNVVPGGWKKWPKMAENWSKMGENWVKMDQNERKWGQNDRKWILNG
jgi:hypothetical protein